MLRASGCDGLGPTDCHGAGRTPHGDERYTGNVLRTDALDQIEGVRKGRSLSKALVGHSNLPKNHMTSQATANLLKAPVRPLARQWRKLMARHDERSRRMERWSQQRLRWANADSAACLNQALPGNVAVTSSQVADLFEELSSYTPLRDSVEQHKETIGKDWAAKRSGVVVSAILFNYAALRLLRPSVVIETGCSTGWTSALMLLALHRNQHGHLHSIDLRPVSGRRSMDWTMPEALEPGFLVPHELRDRWTLTLGDARVELPKLLQQLGHVDTFYHDSDHTYEHMMWEYTTVWPHLAPSGLLISDDIGWNTAAWDLAVAIGKNVTIHQSNPNFGVIAKGG